MTISFVSYLSMPVTGGYYASRAAFIGGFDATSNVRAGRDYGILVSGTMAHSFVESYDDELTAFIHFAEEQPDECVLLVESLNYIFAVWRPTSAFITQ